MDGFEISPDMLKEYLASTQERIRNLESSLLELENNPTNDEVIKTIFRDMHTIKGETGFMQLPITEKMAHYAEDLLVKIRDGQLEVDIERISLLLKTVDSIKTIQEEIEVEGNENNVDISDYQELLDELVQAAKKVPGETSKKRSGDSAPLAPTSLSEEQSFEPSKDIVQQSIVFSEKEITQAFSALKEGQKLFQVTVSFVEGENTLEENCKDLIVFLNSIGKVYSICPEEVDDSTKSMSILYTSKIVRTAIEEQCNLLLPVESFEFYEINQTDTQPPKDVLVDQSELKLQSVSTPTPPPKKKESQPAAKPTKSESSIRIDTALLDRLMNQVGELVLARNELMQLIREDDNKKYIGPAHSMNIITSEIQEGIMKTRLQPIHTVWNRFPRIIRDVAKMTGKDIGLHMEGADTELDKTLIEAIQDPLIHIVRNSADHGVETPEVRTKQGKNPKGMLSLNAYHEGGQVNIVIQDDGAGIDVEKVIAKAVDKKVITQEEASKLSDREALRLIFAPGLSTAQAITNISGRGVGMDVVRSNIEKIGGSIEISSTLGKGTAIQLRIPLTLAIIPALIVRTKGQLYAIPQISLQELVRVDADSSHKIEEISGSKLFRLRGELLPLITLDDALNISDNHINGKSIEDDALNIVVLNVGSTSFGLLVDGINDTEEIVVKPLSQNLKSLSVYSGATILGDGTVALILDVSGLAKHAKIESSQEQLLSETVSESQGSGASQKMLLMTMKGDDQFAIPLEVVDRLEEFQRSKIERSSGQDVIQYRDSIIPLIYLDDVLHLTYDDGGRSELPCVVFSDGSQTVGLVVGNIMDIVEENIQIQSTSSNNLLLGSAIIQSKSTDILDIYQIIRSKKPNWSQDNPQNAGTSIPIMIFEDSSFISTMLSQNLQHKGFQLEVCNKIHDALAWVKSKEYTMILVDVDSKALDGLELIMMLKADEYLKMNPVVALTTVLTDEVNDSVQSVGADHCILKLNKQAILDKIQSLARTL